MSEDTLLPLKEKFIAYYRDLPILKLAAASIGRSEDAVLLWRKADSVFSAQVEEAKAAWAMGNAKKVKSREWLLERVMKDHFSARSELTGKDGAPLPTPIYSGKAK